MYFHFFLKTWKDKSHTVFSGRSCQSFTLVTIRWFSELTMWIFFLCNLSILRQAWIRGYNFLFEVAFDKTLISGVPQAFRGKHPWKAWETPEIIVYFPMQISLITRNNHSQMQLFNTLHSCLELWRFLWRSITGKILSQNNNKWNLSLKSWFMLYHILYRMQFITRFWEVGKYVYFKIKKKSKLWEWIED